MFFAGSRMQNDCKINIFILFAWLLTYLQERPPATIDIFCHNFPQPGCSFPSGSFVVHPLVSFVVFELLKFVQARKRHRFCALMTNFFLCCLTALHSTTSSKQKFSYFAVPSSICQDLCHHRFVLHSSMQAFFRFPRNTVIELFFSLFSSALLAASCILEVMKKQLQKLIILIFSFTNNGSTLGTHNNHQSCQHTVKGEEKLYNKNMTKTLLIFNLTQYFQKMILAKGRHSKPTKPNGAVWWNRSLSPNMRGFNFTLLDM